MKLFLWIDSSFDSEIFENKERNLSEKTFRREIIFWLNFDCNTKTIEIKKILNDNFWDAFNF